MALIFGRGTPRDRINYVTKATYTHAKNLGLYVALYKFVSCAMRHLRGKESGLNSIVGGAVGGFVMFGTGSPINSQINMYVFSRIFFGMIRSLINNNVVQYSPYAYPAFATATWAMVMYLFEHQQGTLQKSLISSMEFLYHDSDVTVS
jgi:peroxisomal membrane protein 4